MPQAAAQQDYVSPSLHKLVRELLKLTHLTSYKRKAGGKGVTMNYIYHKAFWDTEQDRPKVDVEGQRVAMETDVMTLQDLSNVPLVEARILKALEDEGAVLQSMLFNAMVRVELQT